VSAASWPDLSPEEYHRRRAELDLAAASEIEPPTIEGRGHPDPLDRDETFRVVYGDDWRELPHTGEPRPSPEPEGVTFLVRCLADEEPTPVRPYLIGRLDAEGATCLYGTGDTGKGVIASEWIAELVRAGHRVLIVDYESHRDEWTRRIEALGGPEVRRGVFHVVPPWGGSIWHHAAELGAIAERLEASYLVIDSAVPACRTADPLKPEAAGLYASALARIGRPSLTLAHATKADDLRYPFGSVFWHNLARTTWSAKRTGADGHRVILQHRKHNNHPAMGRFLLTVEWWDDLPREVRLQHYTAAIADRLAQTLAEDGPGTVPRLVGRLNAEDEEEPVKPDTVSKALRRGLKADPKRWTVTGTGVGATWRAV